MWRKKSEDLNLTEDFIKQLSLFQSFKTKRWESIDEEVQMSIKPGVPSEDWIIPPDENRTLQILEADPDYINLREAIKKSVNLVKEIASFIGIESHHELDFLTFETPLMGNSALEDGIKMAKEIHSRVEKTNYFIKNLTNFDS